MAIGIITGSGSHGLPGFEGTDTLTVETPYGQVDVARGALAGVAAVQVSRHGAGHRRLSSGVNHRANLWALASLEVTAVIGCTACGAADPELELGQVVVFDDLLFTVNRLPDGSLCTYFDRPGDPRRGHWILHGGPFSPGVRAALVAGAAEAGVRVRDGGTYGHVDGPRFNTPAEIAQLAAAGVSAVSQTGGPETVLAGELELPYALIGLVTDHANEVKPGQTTPVDVLIGLLSASSETFARILGPALARLVAEPPAPAGFVYRFEE